MYKGEFLEMLIDSLFKKPVLLGRGTVSTAYLLELAA